MHRRVAIFLSFSYCAIQSHCQSQRARLFPFVYLILVLGSFHFFSVHSGLWATTIESVQPTQDGERTKTYCPIVFLLDSKGFNILLFFIDPVRAIYNVFVQHLHGHPRPSSHHTSSECIRVVGLWFRFSRWIEEYIELAPVV
jgi:hypothetical protein